MLAFMLDLRAETNFVTMFSIFFPPIWVKIGVQNFRFITLRNSDFRENCCSGSNNLVKGVDEILPAFGARFCQNFYGIWHRRWSR